MIHSTLEVYGRRRYKHKDNWGEKHPISMSSINRTCTSSWNLLFGFSSDEKKILKQFYTSFYEKKKWLANTCFIFLWFWSGNGKNCIVYTCYFVFIPSFTYKLLFCTTASKGQAAPWRALYVNVKLGTITK